MNISQEGIELIKRYEGLRLTCYKCAGGIKTIGYGHTGNDVYFGMTITEEEAEALLRDDLRRFERHVESYNDCYGWTQNEFDALVSFAFNIGNIRDLTYNGIRSKKMIAEKMLNYNKAGGKKLAGLVKRRQEEHDLFLRNDKQLVRDDIQSMKGR